MDEGVGREAEEKPEGQFFDVGSTSKVMDYTEDWSGVWQR